ncbi:MAG: LytR C-terminal domain-containing protein [bacterium]
MQSSVVPGRMFLAFGLLAVAVACMLHLFSQVSRSLTAGKTIYIAVLSEPASLISYHPYSRTVDIINMPAASIKLSGSNQQKARTIRSFFIPVSSFTTENMLYIVPPSSLLCSGDNAFSRWEKARRWLNVWRSEPSRLASFAAFMRILYARKLTNITLHDALLLSFELSGLNVADFRITTVPGKGGSLRTTGSILRKARSPWPGLPALAATAARRQTDAGRSQGRLTAPSVKRMTEPTAAQENLGIISKRAKEGPGESPPSADNAIITVEVLNATNRPGVALKVTRFLRRKSGNTVDVVSFGNHSSAEGRTAIVDRSGKIAASERVRSLLGLDSTEIRSEPDRSRLTDVTVIVGRDFSLPAE